MREIEFRGKTKQGNWAYGVPVESRTNCENWYIELVKAIEYETDIEYSTYVESEEIDENTLGQYTGLKDKNGKKIYEGDIVKSTYKEKRNFYGQNYISEMNFTEEVVWSNDYNGWCLKITDDGINLYRRFNYCEEVRNIKLDNVEVIGNIYDNPELLEEESE